MSSGQVARRYAKAWLSAAKEKNALDSVAGDINALLNMIKASPEFSAFLASPLISKADQTKAVGVVAQQARFAPLTVSMLGLLAAKRRLHALPVILDAARSMIEAEAGTAKAQVISATALDEKKVTDIRNALSKKLGQDVAIDTKIDPSIIGGLIVRVGSTMIDDSVKTKLDRMARRLQGQAA